MLIVCLSLYYNCLSQFLAYGTCIIIIFPLYKWQTYIRYSINGYLVEEWQQLPFTGFFVCCVHLHLLVPNIVHSSLHYDSLFIDMKQKIASAKKQLKFIRWWMAKLVSKLMSFFILKAFSATLYWVSFIRYICVALFLELPKKMGQSNGCEKTPWWRQFIKVAFYLGLLTVSEG